MKPLITLTIFALGAGIVPAMAETFDFSQPLTLGSSDAPGVWYTDRYAPSGFSSQMTAPDLTQNTLEESINAADTQATSFYNTQGRKYDLASGDISASVSLYVDSAWQSQTDERLAGFWATAIDGSNNVQDYPIIEFQSAISSGTYANGGVAGFYGWDNTTAAWQLITSNFSYGSWADLTMTLTASGIDYSVNNTSLISPEAGPDASLTNVMLQGYNGSVGETPQTYNIYWNDLNAAAAPEPGTVGMMFIGVALLMLGMRSRRKTLLPR